MARVAAVPRSGSISEVLHKIGAIFARDARLQISYGASFWLRWVNIAIEVAIMFYISTLVHPSSKFGANGVVNTYFNYLIINMAFVRFQSTALMTFAEAVREGQTSATLELVLSTPTQLPLIVLAPGLWGFTYTAAQTAMFLVVALFFGLDMHHVNFLTLLTFLILTVAAVSPLGVLAAAMTMVIKKTGPLEMVMTSAAVLLGGVYLPVSSLPRNVQLLSWCFPITHALAGFRGAFQGLTVAQLGPDAIWLCLAAIILMPISLFYFARAIQRAKIDGSLAQY